MEIRLPFHKVHALSCWLDVQNRGLVNIYNQLVTLDYSYIDIPKFEFEFNFKLKHFLTNVLESNLFKGSIHDFNDMLMPPPSPFQGYEFNEIQQSTKIKVDKTGTVAAAVSSIAIDMAWGISEPKEHIEFIANRPFFFFIRDQRKEEIYFQGFVANPLLSK